MNFEKKLEQIGIFPEEKVKIDKKNEIAKSIAEKLCKNCEQLSELYNEIYMRIYNCDLYYAEISTQFNGVFYYYKNNSIYISREKQVDDYFMHEMIHYIQNFSKLGNKAKKIGLCRFEDYKILALGINEAIVQYITAKALGNELQRINVGNISIYTNSPTYYKYLTSLVYQVMYFVGENEAISSAIKSDEEFIEKLYNTYEEQTEKILKKFDDILEENIEEKIVDLYFETQELIYSVYFNKVVKYFTSTKDVDEQVEKLEKYEEFIGKILGEDERNNKFIDFKNRTESKLLKEYVEISRKTSRNSLPVLYKNAIHRAFSKIANFFKRRKLEDK